MWYIVVVVVHVVVVVVSLVKHRITFTYSGLLVSRGFNNILCHLLCMKLQMACRFCSCQNEQNLDKSNTEVDDEMPIKPGIGIINL